MGKLVHGGKVYADVVHGTAIPIINFSSWDRIKRIENVSVMEINPTPTTLQSIYKGGNAIACNFSIPIDVTNLDEVRGVVDIGTGYDLTRFPFYVVLCEQYPPNTAPNPSSWSPVATNMTNIANSTYHFSLDTSNLSGGYFLVFVLTGMNATVRDIQIN